MVQVFHKLPLTHDFVTPARNCSSWERRPTTPDRQRLQAYTCPVWADPLSLATTQGVSVDFLSSGYLDVSVPPLASAGPMYSGRGDPALPGPGFPIRASAGQRLFSASPRLIAAVHALHRLLVPRHPPCALTILTVIAPRSLERSGSISVVWPTVQFSRSGEGATGGTLRLVSQNSAVRDRAPRRRPYPGSVDVSGAPIDQGPVGGLSLESSLERR